MGTLDDAIRQHLELKRRAGASEDEVGRLESEAFGPVRHEAPAPAPPAPALHVSELPPPPLEPPPAHAELPEPPDLPPAASPPPVAASPPPFAPSPPPSADPDPDTWLEDDPEDELPPLPQATSEFTAREAHDAGGEPSSDYVAPDEEGEDLLEETPDFLQETPEHDRLWFEQKPPRDFDFDQ